MAEMARARYALLYGPTAGDRIRLADTDLFVEIEEDRSAGGDEAVFGGGKVIRESMGQARTTRAEGAADTVITGAVVLDHWGVVKADVGIRDGRIVALGKAGNPDTMDGVDPALEFDRAGAWGQRLAVPAGTAVRFEPGIERDVNLVPLAGARIVPGLRGEAAGPLDGHG